MGFFSPTLIPHAYFLHVSVFMYFLRQGVCPSGQPAALSADAWSHSVPIMSGIMLMCHFEPIIYPTTLLFSKPIGSDGK